MTADLTCNRFVSCTWCLMTTRNEYFYCTVLHEIVRVYLKQSVMNSKNRKPWPAVFTFGR
ncbi:hypothetical protein MXB_609 [Myxobolus squamalis]|nr:hypothetical protein MXB_609 [Myxobolus squamalis]